MHIAADDNMESNKAFVDKMEHMRNHIPRKFEGDASSKENNSQRNTNKRTANGSSNTTPQYSQSGAEDTAGKSSHIKMLLSNIKNTLNAPSK